MLGTTVMNTESYKLASKAEADRKKAHNTLRNYRSFIIHE